MLDAVALRYNAIMFMLVFPEGAHLQKNDYASYYEVKEHFTGDQYRERYAVSQCNLTLKQLIGKDNSIKLPPIT